jgi:hypothetical protein
MSEHQFKQVIKSEEERYSSGIPIVMQSYALMQNRKTGEMSAQIVFCNIAEERTQDVVVDVLCKDAQGKDVKGVVGYVYNAPKYKRNQEFGGDEMIVLPDSLTRSIEVNITKAVFEDGSEYSASSKSGAIPVQQRLVDYFDDEEIAQQYVRQTRSIAKYAALELDEIWLCSCGAVNKTGEEQCNVCGLQLQAQKELLDVDALKPGLAAYDKEQAALVEQKSQEKRLQNQKTARTKKLLKIFIPIGALILAAVIIWTTVMIPLGKYNDAWDMYYAGEYADATDAFYKLGDYKDSARTYRYLNEKRLLLSFGLIDEINDEMSFSDIHTVRSAGTPYVLDLIEAGSYTVGLRTNGTVFASGLAVDTEDWEDIIDISSGFMHTAGLKADGSVLVSGRHHGTSEWADIVSVKTGADHTVGLKADGSVVAGGKNDEGQCDVQGWSNISAIFASGYATIGIKTDGSVVATGQSLYGELDVQDWLDIVSISMSGTFTMGLTKYGTVVAVGDNSDGQCDTQDWSDIVAISAGERYCLGLRSDGSVVASGLNSVGQCDVQDWENIVMISAGRHHAVGLQANGKVVAAGSNDYGQCNTDGWEYVVAVYAGEFHTVAVKSDGNVIDAGKYDSGGFYTLGIELW